MIIETGFQFRVLMKLDKIIQNQSEEITLLKKLVITTGAANVDGNEDVLPAPVDGEEQLLALCEKVTKEQLFRKQLVCNHFNILYDSLCNYNIV